VRIDIPQLIPLLQDDQLIMILNGNMGGFTCLAQLLGLSQKKKVTLVESNALPYACGATTNGSVQFLRNQENSKYRNFSISTQPGMPR
jgi:hypothetical protein